MSGARCLFLLNNIMFSHGFSVFWGLGHFSENQCNHLLTFEFLYECDYIINTAAETHVGNSLVKSENFVHSNINGVHNLLELIRNYRAESKNLPTCYAYRLHILCKFHHL